MNTTSEAIQNEDETQEQQNPGEVDANHSPEQQNAPKGPEATGDENAPIDSPEEIHRLYNRMVAGRVKVKSLDVKRKTIHMGSRVWTIKIEKDGFKLLRNRYQNNKFQRSDVQVITTDVNYFLNQLKEYGLVRQKRRTFKNGNEAQPTQAPKDAPQQEQKRRRGRLLVQRIVRSKETSTPMLWHKRLQSQSPLH